MGDKLDSIGLVVGGGAKNQSLAPKIFITTGGDVTLDGLASFGRVNAKGGVLLGDLIQS